MRRTALHGRISILRMGEFLANNNKNMPNDSHSIRMRDIHPLSGGNRTRWVPHVDEIIIRISFPKTEGLDAGCARSRRGVPSGATDAGLCVVAALIGLRAFCPNKFASKFGNTFSTWRRGSSITSGHVTAFLRADVFQKGPNPGHTP